MDHVRFHIPRDQCGTTFSNVPSMEHNFDQGTIFQLSPKAANEYPDGYLSNHQELERKHMIQQEN